ncbi:transposase [Kitasatospora sp. NPDC059577]|uniref:transposase n=1 Tax=Kitasatospora sp. NPDC059577 TaxID=3346873 RepID=UPI0036B98FA0
MSYKTAGVEHGVTVGIDVEIVRRAPMTRRFVDQPRRWVVERNFGWLVNHRRLARDYEALLARSEAVFAAAMIGLMTRRLTGETTQTWRGT